MAGDEHVSETPSLLKLYQHFGDITSMHGIGRVLTNSSMWKRVLWSVMFLIGLAFSVYQLVITMNDYYSYPVTTEVVLQHESIATFPGVTFCNLNMMRKSMIDADIQRLFDPFEKMEDVSSDDIRHWLLNYNKANENESGHQLSDMLVKCVFNRYKCSEADFTRINTVVFGACYTFNMSDNIRLPYITRTGPQNGLILELNIEQDEYIPITYKAGVKVIVHPIDEYPFPEDSGNLAHPGAVTSIEFKKEITHRLPAPYSTCVDESGHGSTQRNLFPNKKYTQKACMKSCYQLALYEGCECCDTDVPCDYYKILNVDRTTTTNKKNPKLTFCDPFYDEDCPVNFEDRFQKGELNCSEQCPPACDRTTFETVVSSALWPSRSRFNGFVNFLKIRKNMTFAENTSLEPYIRSNFLRLEIFLDKLEFSEFTTHAKYDWNLLLATIGGLLGLWLGFSLLTAMEIVEVLIDTVLYYTRRKHRKKTTSQIEQN